MTTEPLLRLRDVRKSFGAVEALRGVTLDVRASEVLALVGDNGAGKSTLIKCLAGIHTIDSGAVLFEGRAAPIHGPSGARALGIETVYQDLALCDALDVVANLFLGREVMRNGLLHEVTMEQRTREVLRELDVNIANVRAPVSDLSGGQRQSVAVARAVMWNSRVVVLDEPTAALGVAQSAQVLALIGRLKARGLAVLVVSHNLADVLRVADRVAVLRLGRLVLDVAVRDTTRDALVAAITGAAEAA